MSAPRREARVLHLISCPLCHHRHLAADPRADRVRPCPRCGAAPASVAPFARADWDACRDPAVMDDALARLGVAVSDRKRRLLFCGLGRLAFDWCRNVWFRDALDFGEAWADAGAPGAGVDDLRRRLRRRGGSYVWYREDWVWLGLLCVGDRPVPRFDGADRSVLDPLADVYRDLFPNPFLAIDWKADWRTSAVLGLCEGVYAGRSFGLLPILADALLEAGCDHRAIQDHCRSDRPHARGCWVVDSLLGKS